MFINTGIEYADISKYVFEMAACDDRFVIISPKTNIHRMLETVGYPFKSKEHSNKVHSFQQSNGVISKSVKVYLESTMTKKDGSIGPSRFACPKCVRYQFSPDFSLKVSSRCCDELKKKPFKLYEKQSGRKIAITGIRMQEGGQRANRPGCVSFKGNQLKSFKPLNPCSDDFMEWYKKARSIRLCRLYYEPFNFKRTGCKGCPYSLDLQKQLDLMEQYLPAEKMQCEYIWGPVYKEYRRIGYRLRKK